MRDYQELLCFSFFSITLIGIICFGVWASYPHHSVEETMAADGQPAMVFECYGVGVNCTDYIQSVCPHGWVWVEGYERQLLRCREK